MFRLADTLKMTLQSSVELDFCCPCYVLRAVVWLFCFFSKYFIIIIIIIIIIIYNNNLPIYIARIYMC